MGRGFLINNSTFIVLVMSTGTLSGGILSLSMLNALIVFFSFLWTHTV